MAWRLALPVNPDGGAEGSGGGGTDDQTAAEVPFTNLTEPGPAQLTTSVPVSTGSFAADPLQFDVTINGGASITVLIDEDYVDPNVIATDIEAQVAPDATVTFDNDTLLFTMVTDAIGVAATLDWSNTNQVAIDQGFSSGNSTGHDPGAVIPSLPNPTTTQALVVQGLGQLSDLIGEEVARATNAEADLLDGVIAITDTEPGTPVPLWYDTTVGVERLMVFVNGVYVEVT